MMRMNRRVWRYMERERKGFARVNSVVIGFFRFRLPYQKAKRDESQSFSR